MLKKAIILVNLICLLNICYAEKCPTPTELKQNQFNGWQPFDIDNGTSISEKRLEEFKSDATQLALAEWMDEAPEGSGHCYYRNSSPDTDYLSVFLAKQHLQADTNTPGWKPIGRDDMQCNPSVYSCDFLFE